MRDHDLPVPTHHDVHLQGRHADLQRPPERGDRVLRRQTAGPAMALQVEARRAPFRAAHLGPARPGRHGEAHSPENKSMNHWMHRSVLGSKMRTDKRECETLRLQNAPTRVRFGSP